MSALRMDETEVQEWILRQLGAPQFRIELTQGDLDDAINGAKRWFISKRGAMRVHDIVLTSTQLYDLPEDADIAVEVIFQENTGGIRQGMAAAMGTWLLEDGGIPAGLFGFGSPDLGLSSLVQSRQYLDTATRVVSADPEWEMRGRRLAIMVPGSYVGKIARVTYKSRDLALTELVVRDYELVTRYMLALAKEKLGRVRTRFDSAKTSEGSTGMDGATLLQEAADTKESLTDELLRTCDPMGIIQG